MKKTNKKTPNERLADCFERGTVAYEKLVAAQVERERAVSDALSQALYVISTGLAAHGLHTTTSDHTTTNG
jgi:hypothetical protein